MNHSRPIGTPMDESPNVMSDLPRVGVGRPTGPSPVADRAADGWTLVWVDERRACILQWIDSDAAIQRLTSTVPPRRRSTGHVRHDPATRHGGGGAEGTGEPRRLEHLAAFIREIVAEIPATGHLVIVGPGETRDHVASAVREADAGHRFVRVVESEPAERLTERQLVARLRELNGSAALRERNGSWRWTGAQRTDRPGQHQPPQRIGSKRSPRPDAIVAADEMAAELEDFPAIRRTHGSRAGAHA